MLVMLFLSACGAGRSTPEPPKSPQIPPPIDPDCTATLQWVGPTERVDGTKLNASEIAQYTMYGSLSAYTGRDHVPDYSFAIPDPYVMLWELRDLQAGTNWIWMTATDTDGLESNHSNVVIKEVSAHCD